MDDMYRYMMMSMMNVFVAPIITVAVSMPVVIYILARWRSYRDYNGGDPHLGLKVALSFFKVASYQLMLAGGFLFVYGALTDMGGDAREEMHRIAAGLIVPALMVYAAHVALLNRTNWRSMPAVVRMFNGVNMINTGILGFVALVLAFFMLFQKHVPGEAERMAWSMVLVYTTAWAVQGVLFGQAALSGEVPPAVASYTGEAAKPPASRSGGEPPAGAA